MAQRPFTAVPATRSSKRALRIKQNILIGAVLFGVLLGPIAMVVASRSSSRIPEVPAALPTPVIAFAEIVARDYIAGRETTMPVAKGVPQGLGFTAVNAMPLQGASLVFDRVGEGSIGDVPVTLVRFRVVTVDQNVFNLTVATMLDADGRTVLAALPSLTPALFAVTDETPAPAPDADTNPPGTTEIPRPATEVAESWARAYAENDSRQLRVIVGGGSSAPQEGSYFGIGGFTLAGTPSIPWAVVSSGDQAYARVVFTMVEVIDGEEEAGEGPESANGFTPSVELDLLVADWSSNSPRVVAWGPPGTGPTLEPYENNSSYL